MIVLMYKYLITLFNTYALSLFKKYMVAKAIWSLPSIFDFTIVNTGEMRVVFLTKKYAIKVPRMRGYAPFYGLISSILSGWSANRVEYMVDKSKLYDFVNPVSVSILFSIVIVSPRLNEITEDEFNNLDPFPYGGYEHKLDSIGKTNDGEFKVLDYGNT